MKNAGNRRTFLSTSATLAAAAALRPHVASAQSTQRIKVGQIGTAHAHAAGKLETFRKLDSDYQLIGVVEPDPQRRAALATNKTYADVHWVTEQQLFNTPGLQCVAVETDVNELVATAQRCAEAGMHIHLDKPAGDSLAAFRKLHATATANKTTIQLGYMYRYNPAVVLARRAASQGWLGDVFEVHAVMSKKIGQAARDHLKKFPGGTMYELGCHLIDALVWILGAPDKVTSFVRRTQGDGLADNMLATFEYPQATATIRTSVIEPFGFRRRQFTVVGTEGVADIRPLEPPRIELSLEKPQGDFKAGTQIPDLPKSAGRYDGDLLDLAAVIRGEKQLQWNAQHDLAVHEAILMASGMPIDV